MITSGGTDYNSHKMRVQARLFLSTGMSVCMCVCVCAHEREREREGYVNGEVGKDRGGKCYLHFSLILLSFPLP